MIIRNHLYNGEVTLSFDGFRHKYVWEEENQEIKSVTKILSVINKPALVNWASNMAIDYVSGQIAPGTAYDEIELATIFDKGRKAHYDRKVEAGNIGTLLHKWVENYIRGEDPGMPVNPDLKASVLRFLIWVKKHKVKFLLSEQVIFSKQYLYSGTTDFICTIDGKMYIGDLKPVMVFILKCLYRPRLIETQGLRSFQRRSMKGNSLLELAKTEHLSLPFVGMTLQCIR